MKNFMTLSCTIRAVLLFVGLTLCSFSANFAMEAGQRLAVIQQKAAQVEQQKQADQLKIEQQKLEDAKNELARQKKQQDELEAKHTTEMFGALQDKLAAERALKQKDAELEKQKKENEKKLATEKKKQDAEIADARKKIEDERASLRADQEKLKSAQAGETSAAQKMTKSTQADLQAALEKEKAEKSSLEKDKADMTKKLEESEAYKNLSPEEKAKALAREFANRELERLAAGVIQKGQELKGEAQKQVSKKLEETLKNAGLLDNLSAEEKKRLGIAEKGGILDSVPGVGKLATLGIGGIATLAGLGGIGAGVAEVVTDDDDQHKTATGTKEDAEASGAGASGVPGKTVGAGIILDLSKLTIPSLLPLLNDLKLVMYASKPIASIADQLLKAITTSLVIKVQDSFNLAFAAIKGKAEFDADGAVEQINAKILQDCKDIKSFVANFLDFVGEAKKKSVDLDGVNKTLNMVIAQIKKSYETLLSIDIVAQLTAAQQKIAKADLAVFMKKVNKTVQAALDAAREDVAKTIKKRKSVVPGSLAAKLVAEETVDEVPVKKIVKPKAPTTAKPVATKQVQVIANEPEEESVAVGWDSLMND